MTRALGRFAAAALAGLLVLAGAFAAVTPVPRLTGHVVDLAGTLAPADRDRIDARLSAFERERGSQVVVLTIPALGGETIEDFSTRVTDEWKLGRAGVDDGVLFVVAREERRMRIHTGRGVQGTLTDALSKRIVSDLVAPRFRDGDFAGGIGQGVEAVIKAIEGEALALPEPARGGASGQGGGRYVDFIVLAFFLVPVVAMMLRGIFGRFVGATLTGGATGIVAGLLIGSAALAVVAGFIAFLFGLLSGSALRPGMRGGGWGGGSWGGGGGFDGGGGFSGGGGGFDGGGASGGW